MMSTGTCAAVSLVIPFSLPMMKLPLVVSNVTVFTAVLLASTTRVE